MTEVRTPLSDSADRRASSGDRLHLDCTSLATTLHSLGRLLGRDPAWLRHALRSFDGEAFIRLNPRSRLDPTDRVFAQVVGGDAASITPARVTWFHATRTAAATAFADGILPLDRALPRIWSFLRSVAGDWVTDAAWSTFQYTLDGRGAPLYHLKTANAIHWGPHALLVREAALRPREIGNHDYLGTPEIVEDICQCFEDRFGRDLHRAYQVATRPCLVHFVSDVPRPDTVPVALAYACAALRNEQLTHWANTCFDGEGRAVTSDQIVRFEFLHDGAAGERRNSG